MKRYFLVAIFFSFSIGKGQENKHLETVHQYITREAVHLLQNQNKAAIPFFYNIENHLGNAEQRNFRFIDSKIIAGNYDADHMDAVFYYHRWHPPTIGGISGISWAGIFSAEDPWVSITHFWKADSGDNEKSMFWGEVDFIGLLYTFTFEQVPNAYMAANLLRSDGVKYIIDIPDDVQGNNLLFNKVSGGVANIVDSLSLIGDIEGSLYIKYNSLFQLNQGIVELFWANTVGEFGSTIYWRPIGFIILTQQQKDFLVYDILGRLCHYLQDMSLPTHAHRDIHGSSYDGIADDYLEQFYEVSHQSEYDNSNVGLYINPYVYTNLDPLHFLMYTTNQIADYFSSNGPYQMNGNGNWGGDGTVDEINYLNNWKSWAQQNEKKTLALQKEYF